MKQVFIGLVMAGMMTVASGKELSTSTWIGAAIGAGVGAAIGHDVDDKQGAMIGAAIGGATGAAIGHDYGRRQVRQEDVRVVRYVAPVPPRPMVQERYVVVRKERHHGRHHGWYQRRFED